MSQTSRKKFYALIALMEGLENMPSLRAPFPMTRSTRLCVFGPAIIIKSHSQVGSKVPLEVIWVLRHSSENLSKVTCRR